MKEKIILQADVEYLGLAGEQVEVAAGYARNYLYPKKFGVPATKANELMLASTMSTVADRKKKIEDLARDKATQLEEVSLTMMVKVGEEGRLFGSVTTMDLAKALAEEDWEIDRKKIEIKAPIKSLGEYEATVRLELGITATVKFKVVDETNPDAPLPGSEEAMMAAAALLPETPEEEDIEDRFDADEEDDSSDEAVAEETE